MKARYIEKQIPGAITPMETGGRRWFRFIASQQVRDLDGDTVSVAGVDFTSYYFARGAGPLVLHHDQTRVVGKTLRLGVEILNGVPSLIGLGEIDPPNTTVDADRTWGQLKSGSLNGVSIAFLVLPDGAERAPGGGRLLNKIQLIHIALVSQPALPSAAVLETANAKSCAVCAPDSREDLAARTAEVVAGYYRLLERAVKAPLALPAPGSIGYTILNHADANHLYGRNVAVALVKEACDELKIQMAAAVELIREARESETPDFYSEKGIGGCTFVAERKIYLRYDLLGGDLAECAGHEAYHLTHRGGSEEEATRFGRAFAAKALGHAPRRSGGFTLEQLVAITQVIRSGLPIPR